MGEACRRFNTPVTGGNVSFYNQNPDGPVYPTPTIGMVGLLENPDKKMTLNFKKQGDSIFLLGSQREDINSSIYLTKIRNVQFSPAPYFDIEEELQLQHVLKRLIENNLIQSAHDVSEGGLIVTLMESGFENNLGFKVGSDNNKMRKDAFWFGEGQSRIVVSLSPNQEEAFLSYLNKSNISHINLGKVTNGSIDVDSKQWAPIEQWKHHYNTAIEEFINGELQSEAALGML
jgi:phosphoribosylformylglycinamidine synthase